MAQGKTPLVSVIIPSYNYARYIETCLNSIYDNDYPEIEVTVIDDGSSDGSFEIIQTWRKNHPGRFRAFQVHQQENQGTCRTLNRLVSLAKGEFITALGSDDYLLPDGIRARVDALLAHPGWLAVFGDCIVTDGQGLHCGNSALTVLFKANKQALLDPRFIANELILRWSAPGPSFMARQVCYDQNLGIGLYDENLHLFEDRDYYLRLLARNALGFIDITVAAYRVHQASVSNRQDVRKDMRIFQYQSNVSHFRNFTGLAALWLRLVSLYWLTGISYHEQKNLRNILLHSLTSGMVRMAYVLHTSIYNLQGGTRVLYHLRDQR